MAPGPYLLQPYYIRPHVTKIHPEWFLDYGDKKCFDPASKEVQKFVVEVVTDIVRRYDVDAIHMSERRRLEELERSSRRMVDFDRARKMVERGTIEVAPLAFMPSSSNFL